MSSDGHLPTQSDQEGTSDPTRMNLNETLRSMQQSIEGLARHSKICIIWLPKFENQRKRIGFSKTNISSSRSVVPKSQASTYKSWPKKEDTPKMAFKDHSKPKVEEKGRLVTNPTRCFKCISAINCLIK
ncbi:hypothetical protein M9H77_26828 [Catharanthus roseus]|uniref:Uncharacterized protein n=1 Tax=Catharanthus roseus TaxID=4058 RepID=A0ACC0ACC2_CATRO|nr:hypothetical protein M9H77_26828 [Catharanthus roseus]